VSDIKSDSGGSWKTVAISAFSTGALLTLALPDPGMWYLAPVALAPLFFVLPGASGRRAFVTGWLAGIVANVGIFHWIVHTAVSMSGFPFVLAAGVLLAFSAYSGVAIGIIAVLCRPLVSRRGAVLTLPAVVVAVEFGWPNLFPWHIGNAYFRTPFMLQGTDLTGIYGASFVSAAVSVAVAAAFRDILKKKMPGLVAPVVAAVIVAAWTGYGVVRAFVVEEDAQGADTITLALVQPDITAGDKKHRDAASRKALFARLEDLTLSADLDGVDAVVWPEGAFSFYFATDSEGRNGWGNIVQTSRRLVRMVRDMKKPLIFGTLTRPLDQKTRNSLVMLDSDGAETARYDKRVLLAFGEYMPLSDTFPFLKHKVKEVSDMGAGDRMVAFDIGPAKALCSICYEAIFPKLTRDSMNDTGANLLLNVTNDAWFGDSGAPAQHLMVQVPRALELRVPLVRLTETGISAVVLPSGDFILETGLHERRVDRVEIPIADNFSLYRRIGDVFAWGCVVAVAVVFVQRRRKRSLSTTIG